MKKFCPNCEEMLKAEDRNPAMGHCSGCGWSGHLGMAATEPKVPPVAPKMPYVSIDIETTGLDPATCQILEIGAVWEDWTRPLQSLPTYRRLVVHEEYHGDAYALAMNAELLRRLSGQREPWFLDEDKVADDMAEWLKSCGWDGRTALTPAGKNFASFDRQFLRRLPRFEKVVRLHHRTLDPAILYWQLCGGPHKCHSVAQSIMWPGSFLRRVFQHFASSLRHIIVALCYGENVSFPFSPRRFDNVRATF